MPAGRPAVTLQPVMWSSRRHSDRAPWAHPLASAVLTVLAGVACGEASDEDAHSKEGDAVVADSAADVAPAADTAAADAGQAVDANEDGFSRRWPDSGDCKAACQTVEGTAKVCGSDGCGSVCGFCLAGEFCNKQQTACGSYCKPICDGKKCGDDTCGGDCGKCDSGYACGVDNLCHPEDCKPACGKRICGDNGCGGSCGDCAAGDLCDPTGQCKPGPCKGIPADGQCDGAILVTCLGSGAAAKKTLVDCAANSLVCGWDAAAGAFDCIVKPACTPTCAAADGQTKECGSDGCEGTCGKCPGGWSCPGGFCKPEKGADCGSLLTDQGKCAGDEWIFCSAGKVVIIDCAKAGQSCAWNASQAKFNCQ